TRRPRGRGVGGARVPRAGTARRLLPPTVGSGRHLPSEADGARRPHRGRTSRRRHRAHRGARADTRQGPGMSILCVTGTSTDVGKTVVTAALAANALADGHRVAVCKPAQTGVGDSDTGDIQAIARLVGPAVDLL